MNDKMTKEEYDVHPCVGKSILISNGNILESNNMDYAADTLGPFDPEEAVELKCPSSGESKKFYFKTRHSSYYVCSRDCDGRIPKCCHVIRPRCVSDEGPTCLEIVEEFLATKPSGHKSYSDILNFYVSSNLGREWDCNDCEYWERRDGKSAFSSTHGVESLLSGINSFLTFYLIRMWMSDKERQDVAKGMKMLILFCVKQQYCTKDRGKQVIDGFWKSCSNFQGKKISDELSRLKSQGYWNKLQDNHSKKRSFKEAGLDSDEEDDINEEDNDYDEFEWEDTAHSELPMTVKKITDEGWIFNKYSDEFKFENEILLRLPEAVRKLGKKGMSISCMSLRLKNGIWSPFNPFDEKSACANVYPP